MDEYTRVSFELSRSLTLNYSSSFGLSTRLLDATVRGPIYGIYGLVRIADEVVDAYRGADRREVLDSLEQQTYQAMQDGYSSNPIVHAFAITANKYSIDVELISAFFSSMRMDIEPLQFDNELYSRYIYGSAEVVGLMCLRVFCAGDSKRYDKLAPSARALGSAYQKINFLRDIRADHEVRGRIYFPGVAYETFNEYEKQSVIDDIRRDFAHARAGIDELPKTARAAVFASATYYVKIFEKLSESPIEVIKSKRVRLQGIYKLWLFVIIFLRFRILS